MNSGYQENAMTSEEREEYRALQARLKGLNDKILQAEHLGPTPSMSRTAAAQKRLRS